MQLKDCLLGLFAGSEPENLILKRRETRLHPKCYHLEVDQRFDGMTPAEVAGVNLELRENKWLGYLKKAIEQQKKIQVS